MNFHCNALWYLPITNIEVLEGSTLVAIAPTGKMNFMVPGLYTVSLHIYNANILQPLQIGSIYLINRLYGDQFQSTFMRLEEIDAANNLTFLRIPEDTPSR